MDIITVISSFISGLLCSMGFGGGSVLIIFLTSFMNISQKQAQGINLFFFIPCAIYSILIYKNKKLINTALLKSFITCGLIGVLIGYTIISFIHTDFLTNLFGVFLIVMGIRDLLSKKQKE